MRRTTGTLTLILLATAFACGGGGSGGGGSAIPGDPGGSSNLAGSFTPDQPNPSAGMVTMAAAGSSGAVVTVRIDVTDLSDLFGADFDIVFPATRVEFVNWTAGSVLETGGADVSYLVNSTQPGQIVVGASRNGGGGGGADVVGTGTLIYLQFRVRVAGSATLAFRSATLLDAQSPPQSVPGLTWHGGTLVGN
jgi:hypothetical protein